MKKLLFIVSSVAIAAMMLSCDKDEKIKFYTGTLTIDESSLGGAPSPESYEVTLTNVSTAQVTTITSAGNEASVESIEEGIYDITVQAQFSKNGYAYNYIGASRNVEVKKGAVLTVSVTATKASALVLKELFYACSVNSATGKGGYIKDNFFEVYNNSDQTVYVDGLCIGDVMGDTTYDWSESDFSKVSDYTGNPDDYVFMKTLVWRVPGNGTQYPLAPGESIVIASSAIDHSAVNAASPNLSTADFETYCDYYGTKGQVDAAAPNMELAVQVKSPTNQWLVSNQTAGLVIFFPTHPLRNTDFIESNKANNFGLEVLRSDVVDAVNWVKNETTEALLPTNLDAGKIWVSGINTGESVSRKAASEAGKYQDTNNSSVDFAVNETAQMRRGGAKRPSWSTWGN